MIMWERAVVRYKKCILVQSAATVTAAKKSPIPFCSYTLSIQNVGGRVRDGSGRFGSSLTQGCPFMSEK